MIIYQILCIIHVVKGFSDMNYTQYLIKYCKNILATYLYLEIVSKYCQKFLDTFLLNVRQKILLKITYVVV